jgi:AcrR family transcriptional regulator
MNSSKKTKSRIILSARHLFALFGFHGVSMSKIARDAGVNKAGIYYHFRSKNNLYRIVFQSSLKLVVKNIYSLLLKSRLKINNEKAEDILNQFWDVNPLIMKLFIHELTSGAKELRHVLVGDKQRTHDSLKKLADIFSMLNEGELSENAIDNDTMIRKATQIVAHSMSKRLVDTVISTIYDTK